MYDRAVKETGNAAKKELTFGVSGRLYESNVLLYDHQTESLWSQLKEEAVTGPLTGSHLIPIPALLTTWKQWREQHPQTLVLSTETGHYRNYGYSPYEGYARHPFPMFPVDNIDDRLPLKERVIGISLDGELKAYSLKALQKHQAPLDDTVGKRHVRVLYDAEAQSARIIDPVSEEILPSVVAYWFAWATFHPNAAVYDGRDAEKPEDK